MTGLSKTIFEWAEGSAPALTDLCVTGEDPAGIKASRRLTWTSIRNLFVGAPTADGDFPVGTSGGSYVKRTLAETRAILFPSTAKTTPVDADEVSLLDSSDSLFKKLTWANVKATLKTYFDTIYSKVYIQESYTTANFSKTSDTNLANVTGLTANVVSSGVYRFRAYLMTTAGGSGGMKCAINGTATATAIRYNGIASAATTQYYKVGQATSLGTVAGEGTAIILAYMLDGYIIVNVGGTLTVQMAQNASNSTASTIYAGSTWTVVKIA